MSTVVMKSIPLVIFLSLAVNAPAVVALTGPGQEVFDFTANVAELSGLAWLTGSGPAAYDADPDGDGLMNLLE